MNFYNFLVLLLIQLQAVLTDEKSEELEDEGVVAPDLPELKILSTLEQVWPGNTFPSYRRSKEASQEQSAPLSLVEISRGLALIG